MADNNCYQNHHTYPLNITCLQSTPTPTGRNHAYMAATYLNSLQFKHNYLAKTTPGAVFTIQFQDTCKLIISNELHGSIIHPGKLAVLRWCFFTASHGTFGKLPDPSGKLGEVFLCLCCLRGQSLPALNLPALDKVLHDRRIVICCVHLHACPWSVLIPRSLPPCSAQRKNESI